MNEAHALWHLAVQSLRRRFEAARIQYAEANNGTCLRCALIHAGVGEQDAMCEEEILQLISPAKKCYRGGSRLMGAKPGKSARRWFGIIGSDAGYNRFLHLSREATCCLRQARSYFSEQIPAHVFESSGDMSPWVWFIFELAWQYRLGTALRADKQVWWGRTKYPYDLEFLRSIMHDAADRFVTRENGEERLRERYFSLLPNVLSASVYALDIMAATVPEGASETERLEQEKTDPLSSVQYLFRHMPTGWILRYESDFVPIDELQGMQYIARLLRLDGESIGATALVALEAGVDEEWLSGDCGELSDRETRDKCNARISELSAEIEKATQDNDHARREKWELELLRIGKYLSANFGRRGKPRVRPSDERVSKAVKKAINTAIKHIERGLPHLAAHLNNSITKEGDLKYTADRQIHWVF